MKIKINNVEVISTPTTMEELEKVSSRYMPYIPWENKEIVIEDIDEELYKELQEEHRGIIAETIKSNPFLRELEEKMLDKLPEMVFDTMKIENIGFINLKT